MAHLLATELWMSLTGGLLIGLAVSMLVLLKGRIAGISGILGTLLNGASKENSWRCAFIGGLLLAPVVYQLFAELPGVEISASGLQLVFAGLLVGLGTRYAAGCTSGHGICGLARGSRRSLAATVIFMTIGMLVVYLLRHVMEA